MDNEDDIENNQILQGIDEYIRNNENIDEVMKNFILEIKNRFMSLMDENSQMKIYNINLIKQNDFLNIRCRIILLFRNYC